MTDTEKTKVTEMEVIDDLNLLVITPTKKMKRKLPKIDWNVKQIQEERIKKAKFLLNFEAYNKRQVLEKTDDMLTSNVTKQLDISVPEETSMPVYTLTTIEKFPCLEETFNPDLFGVYFSCDEILGQTRKNFTYNSAAESLLPNTLFSLSCNQHFKIMSTVPDCNTAKYCFRQLVKMQFAVPFVDIIKVFLNWGATVKTLGITGVNINVVCPTQSNHHGKLYHHNVLYVFKYIIYFHSRWQKREIVLLILMLISVALDKTLKHLSLVRTTLSRLIERLDITNICYAASLLIKNFKSMNILNALFVCIDIIPTSEKGNLLATKGSYGLLKIMFDKSFPAEKNCVWSLLNITAADEREPNSYFQHLYVTIKLVENIAIKRFNKNTISKKMYLKHIQTLQASASYLQNNIKHGNTLSDFNNLYTVKEMIARLVNHSQKIIVRFTEMSV